MSKTRQNRPNHYENSLLGTQISFKYKIYQIFQHTEEELFNMDNPFALVVIIAQKGVRKKQLTEEHLQNTRLTIVEVLTQRKNYDTQTVKKFLLFLNNLIHIDNQEYNTKFEQQTLKLTGGKISMGIIETVREMDIQKGLQEGMKLGKAEAKLEEQENLVKKLILKLDYTDREAAEFAEVPTAFVKKIRAELNAHHIS